MMPMNPNLALLASMARPSAQPPSMLPPGMPMPPGMPPGMMGGPMMPPGTAPGGAGAPSGMPMPPMGGGGPPQGMPGRPQNVIRRSPGPTPSAAARGRGGDSMVAHMTPGEIAVPPQVQTPDVLSTLNRAFSDAGANPTSYQAGSPDQKVNPDTGMPEFGFFDAILPTILGVAGSAFLGPAILPALGAGGLGLGAEAAGLIAPAIGGAIGSTAGNIATGHPLGQSLAMGGLGGVGSAAGGALMGGLGGGAGGMASAAGGLGEATAGGLAGGALGAPEAAVSGLGGAASAVPNAGAAPALAASAGAAPPALPPTAGIGGDIGAKALAGATPDYAEMARQYMAANPATGDTSLKATGGLYSPATNTSWGQKLANAVGFDLSNPGKSIGSAAGGMLGSAAGERLFPSTYKPPAQTGNDSGYSNPYRPRAAPVFPTSDQLRNYGRGPQFNYYPV